MTRVSIAAIVLGFVSSGGVAHGFVAKPAPVKRRLHHGNTAPQMSTRALQNSKRSILSAFDSTSFLPASVPSDRDSQPSATTNDTDAGKLNWGELLGLATWLGSLSAFMLINYYIGPWPEHILPLPERAMAWTHFFSAMLFGGGIILTTLVEWLVVNSRQPAILQFWFSKVPTLDSMIVLPALTAIIVSGVSQSVDHYDAFGEAPVHISRSVTALAMFAGWWGLTDLTTQTKATEAVEQWTPDSKKELASIEVPRILQLRRFSNVVSCVFVAVIYGIMVFKPGYYEY